MNLIWNDLIGIFDHRKIIILNYIKSGIHCSYQNDISKVLARPKPDFRKKIRIFFQNICKTDSKISPKPPKIKVSYFFQTRAVILVDLWYHRACPTMNSISQLERRMEDIRKWAQADEPRSVQVLLRIFIACILAYQECLEFFKIFLNFQIFHLNPNCWFFQISEIFRSFLKKISKNILSCKSKIWWWKSDSEKAVKCWSRATNAPATTGTRKHELSAMESIYAISRYLLNSFDLNSGQIGQVLIENVKQ